VFQGRINDRLLEGEGALGGVRLWGKEAPGKEVERLCRGRKRVSNISKAEEPLRNPYTNLDGVNPSLRDNDEMELPVEIHATSARMAVIL